MQHIVFRVRSNTYGVENQGYGTIVLLRTGYLFITVGQVSRGER